MTFLLHVDRSKGLRLSTTKHFRKCVHLLSVKLFRMLQKNLQARGVTFASFNSSLL